MDPVLPDPGVEVLRRRRAELRESMGALELALAAPAPGRVAAWAERVRAALAELSADLRLHVDVTEGVEGLHPAVLATTPRLSNAVMRLSRDHVLLQGSIDDLLARVSGAVSEAHVDGVRDDGIALLGQLIRHRQRGADLVFEAYEADIGGEA
jgi:hypothetical protein